MKYTIQQERLAGLIKNYITRLVGKITPERDDNGSNGKFNFWIGEDGLRYFWTGVYSFEIDEELQYHIRNIFPVKDDDFLIDIIIDWFNSAQDLQKIRKDMPVDYDYLN